MSTLRYVNITIYCFPSFVLMGTVELIMCYWMGHIKHVYRVNDTINSISLGMIQQLFGALMLPFLYPIYHTLYEYRFFNIPNNWQSTLAVLLLVDFLYYWAHRFGHKCNLLWASHSIHHSSENFNLSTALRQPAFQSFLYAPISWFPAALFGVPLDMFGFFSSIMIASQFWIHTRYCQHLGFVERIFNTPSQHIIHHSRSPGKCDKNYGGLLSIWDQLFGTFEIGYKPNKFGTIEQYYTWDPIGINLKGYYLLFKRAIKNRNFNWIFSSSRFVSEDIIKNKDLSKTIRYDPLLTNAENIYCVMVFVMATVEFLCQGLLLHKGFKQRAFGAIYCGFSLSSLAQFMNKSKLGKMCELLRWIIILFCIFMNGYFRQNKMSALLGDNIVAFLNCNIGVVIVKSNAFNQYVMILLSMIALWSIKMIFLQNHR
eukprot:2262_1